MANARPDRRIRHAHTSPESNRPDEQNVEDSDSATAIADTFRVLGLDSDEARDRIRRLVNPAGLEIEQSLDDQRLETRHNTLAEAETERA